MNSELAPYIERLLYTNDTVVVPGLGAFSAQSGPAGIDYAGGKITPPAKTLTFNEVLKTDDGLLTFEIVKEKGITEEDARYWVDQQVEKIQEQLSQREIVAMEGIGRLYKNYMQKVQFLPDAANFSRDNFGLPPLQFSPLSRSREVAEEGVPVPVEKSQPVAPKPQQVISSPNIPVFEAPKPAFQWPNMLLVIGLLLLSGGAGYFALQWQSRKAAEIKSEQTAPEKETTAPVEETPKSKPAEQSSVMSTPDPVPAKKTQEPAVEKVPAKTAPAPAPAKTAPAAGGKECIAVVGVFKDQANIARLKSLIQSTGLQVYSAPNKNGSEMIGARFNYSEVSEIQANIIKLQKSTGEQNIWIKKK